MIRHAPKRNKSNFCRLITFARGCQTFFNPTQWQRKAVVVITEDVGKIFAHFGHQEAWHRSCDSCRLSQIDCNAVAFTFPFALEWFYFFHWAFFFLSLSWLFNGLVVMSDYSGVVDGTVETVFPVSWRGNSQYINNTRSSAEGWNQDMYDSQIRKR